MKHKIKKLISMLLVISMTVSLLPTAANAATDSGTYTVPENVVLYELTGFSGNGKSEGEYLWIDGNTLYVVFCVRGDKPFDEGSVIFSGETSLLNFGTGTLYSNLKIDTNTLAPKGGSDGRYYWQIGTCTIPAQTNGGSISISASGKGGGFAIDQVTYTLAVKYGMEVTKTLVKVNENPASIPVKIGDVLVWEIRVKNTGDFALSGISVADVLSYSGGEPMSGVAELSDSSSFSLQPGEEKILSATYTVRAEDTGKTLLNTATATAGTNLLVAGSNEVPVALPPATITWKNDNGTVLEIDTNVSHGTMPSYNGAIPTKDPDAQYTYAFDGWTPTISVVTGDATYTATYTTETRNYTVIWKNDNGTVLETDEEVPYGTTPTYNGIMPTKDPTAQHTYTFAGWTPAVSAVTGDVTYVAEYTAERRNYAVTLNVLLDDAKTDIGTIHGGVSELYISADGGSTVYKAARIDTGVYVATNVPNGTYDIYVKDGSGYQKICDQIIVLKDADTENSCYYYSVTYDGNYAESGVPAKSIHHLNASVAVAPGKPVRSGYTFKGWQVDDTSAVLQPGQSLTGAIYKAHTLKARWEETVNVTVNVTINHAGGSGYDQMETKDDVFLSLVSRVNSSAAYLETGDTRTLNKTVHTGFVYSENDNVTKYTASDSTFTNMPGGTAEYTVVTSKSGYDTTVTPKQDTSGNWIIDVVMTYNPTNFDLNFTVKVDPSVPAKYLPDAAIGKVTFWSTDRNQWEIITQQEGGKPGVRVDIDSNTRSGDGSYPVWKYESASTNPYGYRIEITAFVYPDGTIVPASKLLQDVKWSDHVYTATVTDVTGGQQYGTLDGAYFDTVSNAQKGTLNAVITMDLHDVTFDAEGGKVNGQDTQLVQNQYKIPDFKDYVPTREGGYTFIGWYEDEACTDPATEGEDLTADITLYAKWKAPLTVSGNIEVAGTYKLGSETKTIQDADRIKKITVMLQYAPAGSNVFSDMRETTAMIAYSDDTGTGTYTFSNVPDDGGTWRVHVLGRNYTTTYQNEISGSYGQENATNNSPNIAKDAVPEYGIASVDIKMEFTPQNFELRYKVDATAIGDGFRPAKAEVLVLYDDEADPSRAPQQWPVISQMQTGGTSPNFTYTGDSVNVGEEDSYSVWTHHPSGHLYDYAIRLQSVDTEKLIGAEPYTVSYNGSAAHKASGGYQNQTHLLTATLTPKTYDITYDLGDGGSWPAGTSPAAKHTWSKDTNIVGTPVRTGYTFAGWTANVADSYAAGKITAATKQNVKLTANWTVNTYTVTWKNDDGTVLETDSNVPYGTTPEYNDATPAKDPTVQYTYTFSGWTPTVSGVEGDVTYTATYTETVRLYTVTWKDYNGSVLKAESVAYGETPDYGPNPYRAPDSQHIYTFKAWTPTVSAVTGNAVYTATYNAANRLYTGRAKIYLDGVLTDAENVLGAGTKLYFSADSSAYYEITGDSGVYENYGMPNGNYHLYSSKDGGSTYTETDGQSLRINGDDAEIAVHYYSVIYNGNGAGSGAPGKETHHLNSTVSVASGVPERSGYIFKGWKVNDTATVLQPGNILTGGITKPYVLTAQWVDSVDIKVNVHLDHTTNSIGRDINPEKDDVTIELVWRPDNDSAPWLEVPGTVKHISSTSHYGFDYQITPAGAAAEDITQTVYTASAATYSNIEGGDRKFSLTFDKAKYELDAAKGTNGSGITAVEAENGDWTIDLYLKYTTSNFDLEFSVEMDSSVPEELYPDAVIARVLYWDGDSWEIISQHDNGKPGVNVPINSSGNGTGKYSVWQSNTASPPVPYGYRFEVSAFVYDGNIVPCTSADLKSYTDGTYTAAMQTVTGGRQYGGTGGLYGAYYNGSGQSGTLKAIVTVPTYKVTLLGNGGAFGADDSKAIVNLLAMPDVSGSVYKPTYTDHIFSCYDWYEDVNKNGTYDSGVDTAVSEVPVGAKLDRDYVLVARWDAPWTVKGTVEVAGTYSLGGETKTIQNADRIKEITVMLQYAPEGSNIFSDIRETTATITYSGNTGTGTYAFADVPDDGGTWRVHALGRNYTTTYQNEVSGGYGGENATHNSPNIAKDAGGNDIAEVNIKMEFSPRNFDLWYKVDASAIGDGFRPTKAEVLVLYDDKADPGRVPQQWPVISQMQTGGTPPDFTYTGDTVNVGEKDFYSVWTHHPSGHLYDYAIRLQSVDTKNLTSAEPYTVSYNGSAFYDAFIDKQNIQLTATLTPKTYDITYELGTNGSWPAGTSPATKHTWSNETRINVIPVRSGYVFNGWTANVAGAYADGKITAATSQNVRLTANWIEIQDITFVGESGTVVYDGNAHSLNGITVTGLPGGYWYEGLSYAVTGTNAGSYTGSFAGSVKIIAPGGKDVSEQFRFALVPGTLVIKADVNGDGKPDDQQKLVTFKVVNGTWGGAGTEKIEYVDLDANGIGNLTLPVDMQPDDGYANGTWDGGTPATVVSGTGAVTYTFRYKLISGLSYTVNYLEKDSGRVLAPAKTLGGKTYGDTVTAVSEKITITGYLYDSANVSTLTVGTGENTLNLYYRKDASATKTLSYVVKHLLDGIEQTLHTATYQETVWVNDPNELAVVAGSLDAKSFGGYQYTSTENTPGGNVIANGTVVILHYTKVNVPPVLPDRPVVSKTGSVTLTKVDSVDKNTTLANVVFELYKADGTIEGTYTTGADGTVTVGNLPVGEHYWIEIRPAEGYMLDTSKHTFTVSGGKNSEISISNIRTPVPDVFSGDHYGYVIGFSDGLVHPEANITRAQVATIFFRLLDEETRVKNMRRSNDFPDVADDMWCNTAVSTLSAMGIINGYADGNFYPNARITRAQFAAIAARFNAAGNTAGAIFTDIYNHWAQGEINAAYNNGWILGYSDDTFRPNQNITRAEAITMINRVLQRVPEHKSDLLPDMVQWPDNMDPSKWYYLAIQEATNSHDYERKENGYECWTVLKEIHDWSELEQ